MNRDCGAAADESGSGSGLSRTIGGKFGVVAGEVGGEKRAKSYAIGNDTSGRDMARGGQVVECGGGVLGHAGGAGWTESSLAPKPR